MLECPCCQTPSCPCPRRWLHPLPPSLWSAQAHFYTAGNLELAAMMKAQEVRKDDIHIYISYNDIHTMTHAVIYGHENGDLST